MPQRLTNEISRSVAIFNQHKRFVGVCASVNKTAALLDVSAANITFACKGDSLTCKGYYLRYWNEDVISYSNLQKLSLLDYDDICELRNFRYYPTGQITRKGMKYKKH